MPLGFTPGALVETEGQRRPGRWGRGCGLGEKGATLPGLAPGIARGRLLLTSACDRRRAGRRRTALLTSLAPDGEEGAPGRRSASQRADGMHGRLRLALSVPLLSSGASSSDVDSPGRGGRAGVRAELGREGTVPPQPPHFQQWLWGLSAC